MRPFTETKPIRAGRQAVAIGEEPPPTPGTGLDVPKKPFLVIILDETSNWCIDLLVRSPDAQAAARAAIQRRKADHSIADRDGDGGFKVMMILDRDDLARNLRMMELPEPDL